MNWKEINLQDYHYDLPQSKIAKYPLKERSASKLLHYQSGKIKHLTFGDIVKVIPSDSLLVFNDTKVIPARLIFQKETGAHIEILLLDPIIPSTLHEETLSTKGFCQWDCMIGNAKKWSEGSKLTLEIKSGITIEAERRENHQVLFRWDSAFTFSEILQMIGKVPLPPYLKREMNEEDRPRYQTVYSRHEGAVAAPTAGLHFSEETLNELRNKGVQLSHLTLHVSSGTFLPMKSGIEEHPMHSEQMVVSKRVIEDLLEKDKVISVGTTSMRTLESLYWYGVKIASGDDSFHISKMMPYSSKKLKLTKKESLLKILHLMDQRGIDKLVGSTEIFLFPGYKFQVCNGLITNYHLPGSTLILLIAAFVGHDWRRIYQEALGNDYRFLSYGDSSLLIP